MEPNLTFMVFCIMACMMLRQLDFDFLTTAQQFGVRTSLEANQLSCPRLVDTTLKLYLTLPTAQQFCFFIVYIINRLCGVPAMKVDYSPSQPVGSGFEPQWRPQPAKLPSFGGYSLEILTLPPINPTNPIPYLQSIQPISLTIWLAVNPF